MQIFMLLFLVNVFNNNELVVNSNYTLFIKVSDMKMDNSSFNQFNDVEVILMDTTEVINYNGLFGLQFEIVPIKLSENPDDILLKSRIYRYIDSNYQLLIDNEYRKVRLNTEFKSTYSMENFSITFTCIVK